MISIIIPCLNEEENLDPLLDRLSGEIWVVDGGSRDRSCEIAQAKANLLHSPPGRALQMNAGARKATGELLWFLHADSKVSPGALEEIQKAVERGYEAGFFSLYFYDDPGLFMKALAKTSHWRARAGWIFGDQGLFIKRSLFEEMGGFQEIPLMEDLEFSQRLYGKVGRKKIIGLAHPLGSSARRFQAGGKLRTLLLMHRLKLGFLLGKDPRELAKMYRRSR